MKRPILFVFGLLLLTVASCSKTEPVELAPDPFAEADPLAIPLADALDGMYSLMDVLYGPATRASERKVGSVEILKGEHLGGRTRAGELLWENLYYIVNFENEGGFAILGADQRSESVLCITEAGSMKLEEILSAGSPVTRSTVSAPFIQLTDLWTPYSLMEGYEYDPADDPDPDGGEYLVGSTGNSFIKQALLESIGTFAYQPTPDPEPLPGQYLVYGNWTEQQGSRNGPYLTTTWHQEGPFNDECPIKGGERIAAGCVPVAVAQIIAWNEKPAASYFGVTSTWQELKTHDYDDTNATDPASIRIRSDMAAIIHEIGLGVKAKYDFFASGQTFAWPANAKKYMKRSLGYGNAKKRVGYKEGVIRDMIVSKHKPVFIAGVSGLVSGHAWVIDGSMDQQRTVQTFSGSKLISTSTQGRFLVHCNFGWTNRDSNGYYLSGIFDVNAGAVVPDPDTPSNQTGNFNWWYRIIEY